MSEQSADAWFERLLNDSPRVAAAFADCTNRDRTLLALLAARDLAGMTSEQVAAWIAEHSGMSSRRAASWVSRFERCELGGNTPVWLLYAYARAVGVAVTITVDAVEASS